MGEDVEAVGGEGRGSVGVVPAAAVEVVCGGGGEGGEENAEGG